MTAEEARAITYKSEGINFRQTLESVYRKIYDAAGLGLHRITYYIYDEHPRMGIWKQLEADGYKVDMNADEYTLFIEW